MRMDTANDMNILHDGNHKTPIHTVEPNIVPNIVDKPHKPYEPYTLHNNCELHYASRTVIASNCGLSSLEWCPLWVKRLIISGNAIDIVDISKLRNLRELDISYCGAKAIIFGKNKISLLVCMGNPQLSPVGLSRVKCIISADNEINDTTRNTPIKDLRQAMILFKKFCD